MDQRAVVGGLAARQFNGLLHPLAELGDVGHSEITPDDDN
jgi:hypothetical protein